MKKIIIFVIAILMIGTSLFAQNNGSSTTGAPAQDPVVVKNYMPQPKVVVTNPDVRVPVNIYMEYPPAPQAPVKDYDYISPYMIFIVILLAGLCVVIGFLFGRNGSGNGSGPVTIHNHGGTGGSSGAEANSGTSQEHHHTSHPVAK